MCKKTYYSIPELLTVRIQERTKIHLQNFIDIIKKRREYVSTVDLLCYHITISWAPQPKQRWAKTELAFEIFYISLPFEVMRSDPPIGEGY
jgi:hypothetical protein